MAVTADRVVVELEARLDRYEANVARAETKFDRAMSGIQRSAKVTEQVVSRAALGISTAIGSIGFIALGKAAVDTALRFKRFEQGLAVATGSSQKAGEEIGFLRELADRLGLRFITLAENFTGFAAAARGTNLEGERAREIFESVTKAIVATGGSMEQVNGALLAVQQMISKGNVSAEELRGQLGERLPGAFQIAARAMGVTTGELDKMLQKGDLATTDFLPRFADQLGKELPGALQTADAPFQRFQTALDDIASSTADGFMKQLGDATDDLTQTLKDMQSSGALEAVGSFLGTVIRLGSDAARVIGDLALSWRKYRLEVGIKQQQGIENGFLTSKEAKAEARRNRQQLEAELDMANNPRVAAFRAKLAGMPTSANDGRPTITSGPPASSSGSSSPTQKKRDTAARKAAQEAERAERERLQREQEDRRIQVELLQAQSALTDNIEAKAQFEREMLEIEKQQRLADLKAEKDLSAEQRKTRLAAIERLYGGGGTEGGDITVDGGGLLPRAVSRELGKRLEEAANTRAEADYDIAREALEGQERLAATRAERERIQLQLLELDFQERKRQLERQRDEAKSDDERAAYQARIGALPGQQGAAAEGVRRSNMGVLDAYADRLTNADTGQQIEELITQELDYVQESISGAITKRLGVKDPFLSGIIDLFIQQVIMKPIADALANAGGQGGGVGGIISGIGAAIGLASGGSMLIGGRGGTDTNVLSLNGRPVANVSRGETLAVGSKPLAGRFGSGAVVNQTFVLDARYGITTPELLQHVENVRREARQNTAAMGSFLNKNMPARMNQFQRDGT